MLGEALADFPDSAAVQLAAGGLLEDAGETEEAMAAYLRAHALEPDNPDALWVLARTAGLLDENDVKEEALMQLLRLQPENPDALWALADLLGHKLEGTGKESTMYKAFEARHPVPEDFPETPAPPQEDQPLPAPTAPSAEEKN